jgi:hypothetical protein
MKRITFILVLVGLGAFGACNQQKKPAASTVPEVSFAQLAATVFNDEPPPVYPESLRKLEGQRIRLTGFVNPYDEPEKLTKLLLLQTPAGCYFCNPPPPTTVVFVRRPPTDPALNYGSDPMAFEGILHLWRADLAEDNEARNFLFILDEAKVVTPHP